MSIRVHCRLLRGLGKAVRRTPVLVVAAGRPPHPRPWRQIHLRTRGDDLPLHTIICAAGTPNHLPHLSVRPHVSVSQVRVLLTLGALIVAVSVPAAASPGAELQFVPGRPVAGPVLGGSRVFWAEERVVSGATTYRRPPIDIWAAPIGGGRPERLHTFPGRRLGVFPALEVSASESHLALSWSLHSCLKDGDRHTCTGHTYVQQVLVLEHGRPANALVSCAGDFTPGAPHSAVDSEVVAYTRGTCPPAVPGVDVIVIRDPGGESEPIVLPQPHGRQVRSIRAAGRYIAWWLEGRAESRGISPELVIYDRHTRETAYRITEDLGEPLDVRAFDLQDDGKIAAALYRWPHPRERICEGQLDVVWYSRSEPTPHLLPSCTSGYEVEIADNQVLYEHAQGPTFSTPSQLSISSLAGEARPVARVIGRTGEIDLNGGRAAWAVSDCFRGTVAIRTADGVASPVIPRPSACPVRFGRRQVRLTRSGHLPVRYSCPRGCEGQLVLDFGGTEREFSLASPPGENFVAVPLPRRLRMLVRRRGTLKLRGYGRTESPTRVTRFYDVTFTVRPARRRD